MSKIYFLFAFLSISILADAQTNNDKINSGLIPFSTIENTPIYPGCVGRNNEALKKCTQESIESYAKKNYDQSIFRGIDLNNKQIRVYVQFTINVLGRVQDVKARAEHLILVKEAIRVIESLPPMTPGKNDGKIMDTSYTFPLYFTLG